MQTSAIFSILAASLMLRTALALVMETKDYVYLGLIAVTAAFFYWHGYLAARSRIRKTRSTVFTHTHRQLRVPSPTSDIDSTELTMPVRGHRIIRPAGFRKGRIRAVFGVN